MIKNSCCKDLYTKCANNSDEIAIIQESRNALVTFYFEFAQAVLINSKNPDADAKRKAYETQRPFFAAAQEGVKKLNKLCANKHVNYVFKGKPTDIHAVFEFSKQITDEIMNDMLERMPQARKDDE